MTAGASPTCGSASTPGERHTWIEAPFNEDRAVWQHLMGDNVWRIDYQMDRMRTRSM
jgi:hypothetical protein